MNMSPLDSVQENNFTESEGLASLLPSDQKSQLVLYDTRMNYFFYYTVNFHIHVAGPSSSNIESLHFEGQLVVFEKSGNTLLVDVDGQEITHVSITKCIRIC